MTPLDGILYPGGNWHVFTSKDFKQIRGQACPLLGIAENSRDTAVQSQVIVRRARVPARRQCHRQYQYQPARYAYTNLIGWLRNRGV